MLGTKSDKRRQSEYCPKCGGNMFHVDDIYGAYKQCLQCGFIKYPNIIPLSELEKDLVNSQST